MNLLRKEIDTKGREGSKLLYNDNEWKVYEILNYEASKKYGKNTMWCISGENGYDGVNYFTNYQNDKVVFYIDIKNNQKYKKQKNERKLGLKLVILGIKIPLKHI